MQKKLYIGNLSYDVTQSDLEELFSQVGEVESATVITDRTSGRSKGFAFVEMKDVKAAEEAIKKFDGTELKGRTIKVNEARPMEPRNDRGRGPRRY